jgi:hypothetical protein
VDAGRTELPAVTGNGARDRPGTARRGGRAGRRQPGLGVMLPSGLAEPLGWVFEVETPTGRHRGVTVRKPFIDPDKQTPNAGPGPAPLGGPAPGTGGRPAAPLSGVIPLARLEDRVAAVLPAGSLVRVTCSPRRELLRSAGLVQPLNVLICRSFAGKPAGPEGGSGPAARA